MIIKSTLNTDIWIVRSDGKSLFGRDGTEWARNPKLDDQQKGLIGYTETKYHVSSMQLTRAEMKRVIAGEAAMRTPTTVDEMRYFALDLHPTLIRVIDEWSDQRLREILIKAEDTHKNAGDLLEKEARAQLEAEVPPEKPKEGPPEATETHRAPRTARSTPRPRKQEGSLSVTTEDISVLLTPKQLEFLERLSECPGWEDTGAAGEYVASEYAQELSDTMNPMSVGAVLTTLREKHLLQTEKRRVGAIRCCVFKLTDLGVQVYHKLSGEAK